MGSLRANTGWATVGSLAQILSQAATIVVLARLLEPYEFGVVSAAALITQLTLVFAEFGVGPYVVQRPAIEPAFIGTAQRLSCAFGALLGVSLWIAAPYLAEVLNVEELLLPLRAYAAVFLLKGWSAVHEALLHRALDFKYLAMTDAVSFFFGYAVVSIALAALGFGYWSIVIGHLAQAALKGSMILVRHPEVSTYPAATTHIREILHFGFGQTLSRLASYVGSQIDGFIVTAKLGPAAIGIYGRAHQLVTMPAAQIGQISDKVMFPSVARIQSDKTAAANAYQNALVSISVLSIPFAVLVALLADEIVMVLLGSRWAAVADPMRWLALAVPFRLVHKVSDPTARALGATYLRAWRQWAFAILVFALVLPLSDYGLGAVAAGVLVAAIVDAVLMCWLCCSLIGLKPAALLGNVLSGVPIGVCVAALAAALKIAFDYFRLPDPLLLIATCMTCAGVFAIAVFKWPTLSIGERGAAVLLMLARRTKVA